MNRQNAKDAKPRGSDRVEPCAGLDELAHGAIGAAIEVHRHLGPGFLENVYEEAMSELVVELKAFDRLAPIHTAQLISYLKAGAFQLGLLINFNVQLLPQGIRRVIWSG